MNLRVLGVVVLSQGHTLICQSSKGIICQSREDDPEDIVHAAMKYFDTSGE